MDRAAWARKYRKTAPGWAGMAWGNITLRVRHDKDYAGVELRMTREEFIAWCVPAITVWWKKNPGKKPSIDRIKNEEHYSIDNIRILEVGENSRRSPAKKNSKAPKGKAWCSGHQAYLSIKLFSPAPSRPPLFVNNRCRECKRAEYRRKVECRST